MSRAQAAATPRAVEDALREVMARPEFQPEGEAPWTEALQDFFEWLGDLFDFGDVARGAAESAALGASILKWTLIVLGSLGLAWWLWFLAGPHLVALRARAREARAAAALERRVDALRRAALEAEEAGDWTRALRLYFFAAVVGLGEAGDLEYRDAWTNHELFERGEPSARVRGALLPLVDELDEHSFGRRPTDQAAVRRFSRTCEELLGRRSA